MSELCSFLEAFWHLALTHIFNIDSYKLVPNRWTFLNVMCETIWESHWLTTSQWHWRYIPRWPSPLIMSANVLGLWGNHNHLYTCFLWADSFICLANTGSYAALKMRLSPGNGQRGIRNVSAKKSRVSKFTKAGCPSFRVRSTTLHLVLHSHTCVSGGGSC